MPVICCLHAACPGQVAVSTRPGSPDWETCRDFAESHCQGRLAIPDPHAALPWREGRESLLLAPLEAGHERRQLVLLLRPAPPRAAAVALELHIHPLPRRRRRPRR